MFAVEFLPMEAKTLPHERKRSAFGKDELNLADWSISVSTHQQVLRTTATHGKKIDSIEYLIPRKKEGDQRVKLMAPAAVGLPTPIDEDVLIGLMQLSYEQDGFQSAKVCFTTSELYEVLRWKRGGWQLDRVRESLRRLINVNVEYELIWYDRDNPNLDDIVTMSGILSDAEIVKRKTGQSSQELKHWIHWTHTFHKSLVNGNLTNLDLDLYFSLTRPSSKRLLRHLNKRFYGPRSEQRYERDMKHLACGHLGMKNSKDLRRNLHRAITELEEREYIVPLPVAERFNKVSPSTYRVVFDLHPSRVAKSRTKKPSKKAPRKEAKEIVTTYYEHRFKKMNYEPRQKELERAEELLAKYDVGLIMKVLPLAAENVKTANFKGGDQHFGAARTFIESLCDDRLKRAMQRKKHDEQRKREQAEASLDNAEREENRRQQRAVGQEWGRLSTTDKQKHFDNALAKETSESIRRHIKRQGVNNPAMQVIKEFRSTLD